ncbi:Maf family protein [Succinimonas amylolytica]|uniref:Maf family protein n=1 Tax=Succinimonas amylolytica TaxID=83769 RepID=UPI00037EFDCE|nr:Maf family protein [Succinimonas amylolytica]
MTTELILASGSPRRREILEKLGFVFRVLRPEIDESRHDGESPEAYVRRLSYEKARAVQKFPGVSPFTVILAADTTIDLDGDVIGKPASKSDFFEIMTRLAGNTHQVITGFTVLCGRDTHIETVVSQVSFCRLTPFEIEWYWNTGEPCDKAGGYAIQGIGRKFVSDFHGSFSNIIGLPEDEVLRGLSGFGVFPSGGHG